MKWIFASVLFVGGAGFLTAGNANFWKMLDAVNHHLPENDRISPIGANLRAFEIWGVWISYWTFASSCANSLS
jgi:hypothetical protein